MIKVHTNSVKIAVAFVGLFKFHFFSINQIHILIKITYIFLIMKMKMNVVLVYFGTYKRYK